MKKKFKEKFKVLHVITRSHPYGGAQRNTWLSVSRAGEMFEQYLAAGPGDEYPELCREHNIPYFLLEGFGNPLNVVNDTRVLFKLVSIIKKEKIDIVHLHSSKAGFVGRIAAKLAGVPVIVFSVHGVSFDKQMRGKSAPVFLMLERMLKPITDGIVSVAQGCKDDFVNGKVCKPDDVRVIYSAIEYEPIDNAVGGIEKRKELGFTEDDFIIGAVGYVRKVKGYEYLVESASHVIKEIPQAKFIIIGDGSQRQEIEQMIRDRNLESVVRILGERDDVPELLKIMNVFVRPSIFEGLGRALTEGMYASLPPVVTDLPGAHEIIEEGVTGYMTPLRDGKAMADKIVYLYKNPEIAQIMGKMAHEKVKRMFAVSTMVGGIEEYYKELLNKKGYSFPQK